VTDVLHTLQERLRAFAEARVGAARRAGRRPHLLLRLADVTGIDLAAATGAKIECNEQHFPR
jgi:hypothetical protein